MDSSSGGGGGGKQETEVVPTTKEWERERTERQCHASWGQFLASCVKTKTLRNVNKFGGAATKKKTAPRVREVRGKVEADTTCLLP
ncbi:GL24618 [Drosophila persimilis]|uniref:GL24618 n=1 Tax=Drosophila persimilis TaxID=7234 RepID=B4H5U5_DROPE|nr:GL24618 [Drosophila persimilis]